MGFCAKSMNCAYQLFVLAHDVRHFLGSKEMTLIKRTCCSGRENQVWPSTPIRQFTASCSSASRDQTSSSGLFTYLYSAHKVHMNSCRHTHIYT